MPAGITCPQNGVAELRNLGVRRGYKKTAVMGVSGGRGLAGLPALAWPSVSPRTAGIGLAVLASAAAASMICALLPGPAISPAAPAARQASQASAADQRVARPADAAFDIVKVWTEERAQLFAAINPGIGGASVNAWASIGGVSILPATRFTSASHVATGSATLPSTENRRSAEAATAVPLPPPSPLARLNGIKRMPSIAKPRRSRRRSWHRCRRRRPSTATSISSAGCSATRIMPRARYSPPTRRRRSTISRSVSFICRTATSWKRIRAMASGSTIPPRSSVRIAA